MLDSGGFVDLEPMRQLPGMTRAVAWTLAKVWDADISLSDLTDNDRSAKVFFVQKADIAAHKYDLSINRYKEIAYETVSYDPPLQILDEVEILVGEIHQDLQELREMVR